MSAKVMKLWQLRPEVFMKDNFEFIPDAWQLDAIELYLKHQRLAMICSKGPGKTALLAMFGWHFFLTNKLPKIAALSISSKNLKANLWSELALWGSQSDLVIKSATVKSERITLNGYEKISFIDARSFEKEADEANQASALAGLHANNVGFLIDEGGDIPSSVLITADAALSGLDKEGHKARLLVAANPTTPSGLIYRASKGATAQDWATLHVSGDPDDPKRATRVSKEWARSLIQEYGIDSPYTQVNVFGRYPQVSDTTLLTEEEIDISCKRDVPDERLKPYQSIMGVDVARGGSDSTILAIRRGKKVLRIIPLSSALDGPELAGQIIFHAEDLKVNRVIIDTTGGFGGSVYDCLKYQKRFEVEGLNYSSKARNDKMYFNARSEIYCKLRDWIRDGGKLLPDPRLKADLMTPQVSFVKNKFKLEEKEQIKKRLGRSPDRSDALAQTFFDSDHYEVADRYRKKLGMEGGYSYKREDETKNPNPNYISH